MNNYLAKILAEKKKEVGRLLQSMEDPSHPFHAIRENKRAHLYRFSRALRGKNLAIIAEIKRASPSKGLLHKIPDPKKLAERYQNSGVAAISVLTDSYGFQGSLEDLKAVSQQLKAPTLRKDFIIHPVQLLEAVHAGASAVLLIASLLKKELPYFLQQAKDLGLETLTEVHSQEELDLALEASSPIIGVNHRNLTTFCIDQDLSKKLKSYIPSSVISVAESGINTKERAAKLRDLGYDAILVGEALVLSENPEKLIQEMQGGAYVR